MLRAIWQGSRRRFSRAWCVFTSPYSTRLLRLSSFGWRRDGGRSTSAIRTNFRVLWAIGDRSGRRLNRSWWVHSNPKVARLLMLRSVRSRNGWRNRRLWRVNPSPKAFLTRLRTIGRERRRSRSVRLGMIGITSNNVAVVTEYFMSYELLMLIVNVDLPNDRSTQSGHASDGGENESSEECETHV